MVVAGTVLLVLGFLLKVHTLSLAGFILVGIGAAMWVLGSAGYPVGGRRYWY